MKKFLLLALTTISLSLVPAFAQMGQGPRFDGAIAKLFGANQSYSATLEIQTKGDNGDDVVMPGKLNFDTGKARFEMSLSEVRSAQMPAGAAQQMKAMGMDNIISISRPDLKLSYLVYPGLNSYAEMALQDKSTNASPDDYKMETADLGKETVDGHDCAKEKVTVTDKDGNKHEFTAWNASDLKNFPVKIEMAEGGRPATMLFKNVSFTKPAISLFEAPAGLTKYSSVQTMMQTEMMKKMHDAAGTPPGQQ